jgi:myo-inositol-1(or 4)-monophosphatase
MMDLELMCGRVCQLAKETGSFIKQESLNFSVDTIEVKGANNFVTYIDKTSEKKLVEGLKSILPEAGFITEEGTVVQEKKQFRWVIDPLDGTTNFIHGLPPYAISIGLLEDDEPVLGVVFEIVAEECFYAWKGSKAYLNGKEIHVSKTQNVSESLIATGFPYFNFSRMNDFLETLSYFFVHSHGVRRIGSAATDLAYVACGRFDAFYEYGLNPWDVAAGIIIIKMAGGTISDFKGNNNYLFGGEIIADNSKIHNEFSSIIHKHLIKK